MHHELFLALLGQAGDVFEARREGFFVRADVTFVTKPQVTLLNRLLALGHAFATLEAFVRVAETLPSIYVRALAQSLERLLQQYADAVVALERKVLAARAVFPLPQMVYELEAFTELLPELCKLVRKLEVAGAQQPSGCIAGAQLLDLLHRATSSGFPRIRSAMQGLLFDCNRILFKQMLAWILYGEITDPFREFFVCRTAVESAMDAATGDVAWHRQFALDLDAVPLAYVPLSVAESVLFIGKSMQILVRANEYSLAEAQTLVTTVAALAQQRVFDATAVELAVERVRLHIAARLHAEVVVKSHFGAFLSDLKGFFLLARGELFQTLIERSDALMALRPTHKSEDELNSVVWHQVVRDVLGSGDAADEATRLFSLKLPLQTFAFRGFTSVEGLALLGGVARDPASKSLEVRVSSSSEAVENGALWWKHVQHDASAFSCDFAIDLADLPPPHDGAGASAVATRRLALFFKNEDTFVVPASVDGAFRIDQPQVAYVSIECALELEDSGDVAVVAQITASRAREEEVRTSPRVIVPMANGTRLSFQLQYARQEFQALSSSNSGVGVSSSTSSASSTQIMYKKVLQLAANGIVVLETKFDFQQALSLQASGGEHWLGLALTRGVRLAEWSLERYAPKASWSPGSSLRAQNASLSPRELWSYVGLHCDVQWPLQLLVTKDVLRSYAHLFQFGFRLKRVAYALERAWKSSALRPTGSGPASRAVAHASALRGRMSFVVRNVALYFQVFVIESSARKCARDVAAADDFDRVKRLHDAFVAALVKKCYLHTRTVASALDQVLSACWRFVEYVLPLEQGHNAAAALSFDRVAVLEQDFQTRFDFFYGVLQHSDARDLVFLLDYNGFFSTERELRKQQRSAGGATGAMLGASSASMASMVSTLLP